MGLIAGVLNVGIVGVVGDGAHGFVESRFVAVRVGDNEPKTSSDKRSNGGDAAGAVGGARFGHRYIIYYNWGMEYLSYMLVAAVVGATLATLCIVIINLLGWKVGWLNRGKQRAGVSFKACVTGIFYGGRMTLAVATVLTSLTVMALMRAYAGSSVGAGYDLLSFKALPFYALVAIDVVAVISGIVGFVEEKSSRKLRVFGAVFGLALGFVIAWFTIGFFEALGCSMPWYGG